ncbi:hypothetical protein BGX34_007611 [Mortierella sp. NVP85]|nr:hypothetical protein BGX34_007611 [Mortierella sp. NVP85]
MSQSVHIIARRAGSLEDVERFGKNDPYAQFSLDLEDKDSFKKTSTKKNAGKSVEWNEVIVLDNYDSSRHTKLYAEILDQESLGDEPIGYATIPLYQVVDAPGNSFKGRFDLFDDDNKQKGYISLTITIIDSDRAGEDYARDEPEVDGESTSSEEHQKRIKKLKLKEQAGAALFGAKSLLSGNDERKED